MFDKNQAIANGPGTIVGVNVRLTGVLKDANDVVIYGQIEGEVISDKNVMVEENASVKGPITAEIVTVSGSVNGSIVAKNRLEITPTGKVSGSITSKDLIIKSGAQFDGKSTMIRDKNDTTKKTAKDEKDVIKEDKASKTIENKIEELKPEID